MKLTSSTTQPWVTKLFRSQKKAYELLLREKKPRESFSEAIKRLAKDRGKLQDSFGAWKMNDDEEERIFSSLNKNWKKWNNLTTADLAGSGRKHASVSEMKRLLDRMRAEDA